MMEILTIFINFQLNQIQNCYVQTKKIKDKIFSFQLKKNTSGKRLQTMLTLKNVPPLLDLTRILKSYHKRNDRIKFQEKLEWPIPHEINPAAWLVKNSKHFSVNSCRKFLSWQEARRQGRKQATGFLPTDRYFSFFWLLFS